MARMTHHRAATAVMLVAGLLAGCGSARRPSPPAAGPDGSRPPHRASIAPAGGGALFRYQCGACHTVGDPNSPNQGSGGDLLPFRLPRQDMLAFAREMPQIHGPRTEGQLEAIVDYLRRLQRGGPG